MREVLLCDDCFALFKTAYMDLVSLRSQDLARDADQVQVVLRTKAKALKAQENYSVPLFYSMIRYIMPL